MMSPFVRRRLLRTTHETFEALPAMDLVNSLQKRIDEGIESPLKGAVDWQTD
jgi:hypothetical protein